MEKHPEGHDPNLIHMPAPTAWPMVTAFAMTLICAGLVTSWAVSILGLVLLAAGSIGWWLDVLPVEKAEYLPMRPESERAEEVVPVEGGVSHLKLGQAGHRVRIPVEVTPYGAGFVAGLAGGAVMAVLACLYGLLAKGSIWYPINLLAAAGVPSLQDGTLATLKRFHMEGFIVASIAHVTLSLCIGWLYAVILPMFPKRAKLLACIVTPLMWSGLVYASLWYVNPLMSELVDWWVFWACQIAFGMVAGFMISKTTPIETMQTWPLALRAGLELPASANNNPDEKKGGKP